MRKYSVLGIVALAHFATVGMGIYLSGENGKVSLSNLSALLFVVVAAVAYLSRSERMKTGPAAFLLFFNLCAAASFAVFEVRYGWAPNFAVLIFQELEFVLCLLVLWYAPRNPAEFRSVVRLGTFASVALSMYYGIGQLLGGYTLIISFGMDDKSQTAVLFCCQAFILIRYFGGLLDCLVAIGLVVMSFLTLSRLPVVFIPVILVALAARRPYGRYLVVLSSAAVLCAFVFAQDAVTTMFRVFDRLSSLDAVASGGETTAHLLLLKTAVQLKFTDAFAFLFGTGPGNFAAALTSFPLPHTELYALDPALVDGARLGKAPMHSVPFSALLDYNILVFSVLVLALGQAIRHLAIERRHVELFFYATLAIAGMFYSLHNKPYFFLLVVTVYVLMRESAAKPPGKTPRTAPATSLRTHRSASTPIYWDRRGLPRPPRDR